MRFFHDLITKFKHIVLLEKTAETGEVILKQRRVFTLPSKAGLMFIVLLLTLFLTSTNYNLNLGFGMTYLLAGLAAVNALFTFRNLAYLRLNAGQGNPIFVGDVAEFPFQISNPKNLDRYALHIGLMPKDAATQVIDLKRNETQTVKIHIIGTQRGYLACPRIKLQTWFPLGLLRAWSTWMPASKILVYPAPEVSAPPLPFGTEGQGSALSHLGNEDFSGVRSYQSGDPLKHLSWKHIARIDLDAGGNLISKQFSGTSGGSICLDFSTLPPQLDLELRLSRMCSWILEAERQQLDYAFKLRHIDLSASQGEVHRAACLEALATFELDNAHE